MDENKKDTDKEIDSDKENSSEPVQENTPENEKESDSKENDSKENDSDDKEDEINYKEKYLSLKNKVDQDTKESEFNKILTDKNIPQENHSKIKELLRNSENIGKDLDLIGSMITNKAKVSNSLEVKENKTNKEEKKGADNWKSVGAI